MRRRTLATTRAASLELSEVGASGLGSPKPFEFGGAAAGAPDATVRVPEPVHAGGWGVANVGGAFGAVTASVR
jgi:hypothetical protein